MTAACKPMIPVTQVGQEERRLQVRAYNLWTSLLNGRPFPSFGDLHSAAIEPFAANSVFFDCTANRTDPVLHSVGERLVPDDDRPVTRLSEIPDKTPLACLAERKSQLFDTRAPLGFEAEIERNRSDTVLLCRGILLPFSSDHDTIDYIWAAINWKEYASSTISTRIEQELKQSANDTAVFGEKSRPLVTWADGPLNDVAQSSTTDVERWLDERLAGARESARLAREARIATLSLAYDVLYEARRSRHDEDTRRLSPLLVASLALGERAPRADVRDAALILSHGLRANVPRGNLADYLSGSGFQAALSAERRYRLAHSSAG